MAYTNVAVSNGHNVLQQLASFASGQGWNVHFNGSRPANTDDRLLILSLTGSQPYIFIMYEDSTSSIHVNVSRALDLGADWDAQPSQFRTTRLNNRTRTRLRVDPILSVHMFAGSNPQPYIYVAIEKQPGYYRHLVFGFMDKFGASLGGFFWDVSCVDEYFNTYADLVSSPLIHNNDYRSSNYARRGGLDCQDEAGAPMWASFSVENGNDYNVCGMPFSEFYDQHSHDPNEVTLRTTLIPLTIYVKIGVNFYPYGSPPKLRYVNMAHYAAGDELTVGGETWKVFPVIRKHQPNNSGTDQDVSLEGSQNIGIAYLKD